MNILKRLILAMLLAFGVNASATDYYTASGDPVTGSALSSAVLRAEYAAIGLGFTKLAPYTGAGNRIPYNNAGGTAQTNLAGFTFDGTTFTAPAGSITNNLAINGTALTTSSASFTAFAGATTLLTIGGTGATAVVAMPGTLDATTPTAAALKTAGGLGVAKALWVGGLANIAGATTLQNALTYGGVTLTNSVTGTGSMVLSAGPTLTGHPTFEGVTSTGATGTGNLVYSATQTLTGTLTAAIANFSGLLTANAGISVPTGQSVTGAGTATVTGFATVSATTLTGTLSTAAQPNVTSVGTLTSLVVGNGAGSLLSVGVTPKTWDTYTALTIGGSGASVYASSSNDISLGSNIYRNAGFKRVDATHAVSNIALYNGSIFLQYAAVGAADSAVTLIDGLVVNPTSATFAMPLSTGSNSITGGAIAGSSVEVTGGGSTTISTGVGSVKMSTTNAANNTAWIPVKYAGSTYYVPAWTTNSP